MKIDLQDIRELAALMVGHDLSEIQIVDSKTMIALRRRNAQGVETTAQIVCPAAVAIPASVYHAAGPASATSAPAERMWEEDLIPIISPMIGTFYASSGLDSPPFVEVGREIETNTPVCTIEAMKVFNEIRAEVTGTIARILVSDREAVEFGQPLMLVRPRSSCGRL